MTTPKILYAWEYGSDLGHISVFLPIAKNLRHIGYQVVFAIPTSCSNIKAVITLLLENDFTYIEIPGAPATVPSRDVINHAGLIRNIASFQNSAAVNFILRSWLSIFSEYKPDIVICDFALGALLAARALNLPRITMDFGFFLPDIHGESPDFDALANEIEGKQDYIKDVAQHAANEKHILDIINSALNDLKVPVLRNFIELYDVNKALLLSYPELSPFKHINNDNFYGAVLCENAYPDPKWPLTDEDKPKVFAYLKFGMPGVKEIMEVLANDSTRNVIIYLLGCNDAIKKTYTRPHLQITTDLVNIASVLEQVDLVICQAGVGFITQTLLAGKPLLLAPKYFEQTCNAYRAVQTGAALSLPKEITEKNIQERIETLLSESHYIAHARAFRYRNQPADINKIATAINDVYKSSESSSVNYNVLDIEPGSAKVKFSDLDTIFLAFDEPNADDNWQALKKLAPGAKRIDGINHLHEAYNAAANIANTERFILIDSNNQVNADFFTIETFVPAQLRHSVWQWNSTNHVTGLTDAYSGIKVWTKELVQTLSTPEIINKVDSPWLVGFWSQPAYQVFAPAYSENYTNTSPYQAFSSSFYQIVLLSYCRGEDLSPELLAKNANHIEVRRMAIWMSAGADVDNGYWSMLGARMGFLYRFSEAFDLRTLNDPLWMQEYWNSIFTKLVSAKERSVNNNGKQASCIVNEALQKEVLTAGEKVRLRFTKPPIIDMDAESSANFKAALSEKRQQDIPIFSPAFNFSEL